MKDSQERETFNCTNIKHFLGFQLGRKRAGSSTAAMVNGTIYNGFFSTWFLSSLRIQVLLPIRKWEFSSGICPTTQLKLNISPKALANPN